MAAGLAAAPAAHATCASFFGIGNSSSCTSTPTSIAIAIGHNAWARAEGMFGTAIAIGDLSQATIVVGRFNLATAVGYQASAGSDYDLSLSFAVGDGSFASAAAQPGNKLRIGNIAIAFAPGQRNASAYSSGVGNIALNLFGGHSSAAAFGRGNTAFVAGAENSSGYAMGTLVNATVVLSTNTLVHVEGTASAGFGAFGSGNTVKAGPGPLAIAGSIGQNNATVTKAGPGININGVSLGGKKTPSGHPKGTSKGSGRSARP